MICKIVIKLFTKIIVILKIKIYNQFNICINEIILHFISNKKCWYTAINKFPKNLDFFVRLFMSNFIMWFFFFWGSIWEIINDLFLFVCRPVIYHRWMRWHPSRGQDLNGQWGITAVKALLYIEFFEGTSFFYYY